MAIAMRSYLWIHVIADLELEDQILQVKYSIPLYTVCYMETQGDKILQKGPKHIRKFCTRGSKNFNKIEINYPNILI